MVRGYNRDLAHACTEEASYLLTRIKSAVANAGEANGQENIKVVKKVDV
jgi:hypothetical protein